MAHELDGWKVAVLVADGFEQVELTSPLETLREAGAEPVIVAPGGTQVRGWDKNDWGEPFGVGDTLDGANPNQYDALVLPGGVMNPDNLRTDERAVRFIRAFFDSKKPVAAICHGPWTLIEAKVVKDRRMTSFHSIQTDLKNAGADWVDEEAVVDGNLLTSRNPGDLPAFNRRMLEEFAKARSHAAA